MLPRLVYYYYYRCTARRRWETIFFFLFFFFFVHFTFSLFFCPPRSVRPHKERRTSFYFAIFSPPPIAVRQYRYTILYIIIIYTLYTHTHTIVYRIVLTRKRNRVRRPEVLSEYRWLCMGSDFSIRPCTAPVDVPT